MPHTAKILADNASFQAFTNCYLREVDIGVWHNSADWHIQTGLSLEKNEPYALELQLTGINITLALNVAYHSVVGRHVFTRAYKKLSNDWTWQEVDFLSIIMMLIDNIYAQNHQASQNSDQKIELLTRTLESHQVMQAYLSERLNDSSLNNVDFIASEQSLLFGHWLHPTPKSRQGLHTWQHPHYTPELQAYFQLHYFAISRELLQQNSLIEQCVEQIINEIAELDNTEIDADKQLVPVHPLQAQWLLHQDYMQQLQQSEQVINLGTMGKFFTPTSSVRTLYNEELNYMIKLSIPVKITNSLRQNMAHELAAGLNVGKLLESSQFYQKYPQFSLIEDPAYITLKLPDREESGFETIIRRNPFTTHNQEKNSTLSIAALVQEPILADTKAKLTQQVIALAAQETIPLDTASLLWFDRYWHCAIEPAIWLYESQGVALEAHQQNSLITITGNSPSHYYYRDNQGFYLSNTMKEVILIREPALHTNLDLFYDDDMIADRFGYYLMINQLFSIISRFGQDGLIAEEKLLQHAYYKLSAMLTELNGVGANFINALLNSPTIPCKANLLTRVEDVDELQAEQELAVYTEITNPYFNIHQQAKAVNAKQHAEVNLVSA